jgi:hypothetical protein
LSVQPNGRPANAERPWVWNFNLVCGHEAREQGKERRLVMGVVKRCVAGILALSVVGAQAQQVAVPVFDKVANHLQPGGNFYLVTTFEGAFERGAAQVMDYMSLIPSAEPEAAEAKQRVERVIAYLRGTGLFSMNAFGISTVPRADGDYDMKLYLGAKESSKTPLMRLLLSGPPRKIGALAFVPADAVVAAADTSSFGDFWRVVEGCIEAACTPEEKALCDTFLSQPLPMFPIALNKLLSGIGEEDMFALILSSEKVCYLPTASGPVEMPEPSFVAALQLASPELGEALLGLKKVGALPVMPAMAGEVQARSILIPAPVPFPFQLTYTVADDYLLIGSTPDALKAAIAARANGNGLVATDAFRKAFEGQPVEACSALSYSSRRFGEEVQKFQTTMMAADGSIDEQGLTMLRQLLDAQSSGFSAITTVNTGDALIEQGVTSTGGGQMLTSLLVVPLVGLTAAIAVPSFVKARKTSIRNSCINNLRQIDSAKEQWAMEQAKRDGDAVDEAAAAMYIKNGMPTCPDGGVYTIGTIGENPTCTVHGDTLSNF